MQRTLIRRAEEWVYKPMIHFRGKYLAERQEDAAPHPCAPEDVRKDFGTFLSKLQSTTRVGSEGLPVDPSREKSLSKAGKLPIGENRKGLPSKSGLPEPDYKEWWDLPKRYWDRPIMGEKEIELIESGGASEFK